MKLMNWYSTAYYQYSSISTFYEIKVANCNMKHFSYSRAVHSHSQRFHFLLTKLELHQNVCFPDKPVMTIPIPTKGPKVTSLIWGTLDEQIITVSFKHQ